MGVGADGQCKGSAGVMRIQAELVDGIEHLTGLGPATVFGSARLQESDEYYADACRLGQLLAEALV